MMRGVTHTKTATVLVAVLLGLFATSAMAQSGRLSLAERVAKLEAKVGKNSGATTSGLNGSAQSNMNALNQMEALRREIQELRNMVELQNKTIAELQSSGKAKYIDLDSRVARLEGGAAPAPTTPAAPVTSPPVTASGNNTDSNFQPVAPVPQPNDSAGLSGAELNAEPNSQTNAAGSTPPPPVLTGSPEQEQAAYERAFELLKAGDYVASARQFNQFVEVYPNGRFAPNGHYWLGESYYVTQNYQLALDSFQTLLRLFPDSNKAPDALLKVGYCQYELGQKQQAEATLMDVMKRHPQTMVASLAERRLRAIQLEQP